GGGADGPAASARSEVHAEVKRNRGTGRSDDRRARTIGAGQRSFGRGDPAVRVWRDRLIESAGRADGAAISGLDGDILACEGLDHLDGGVPIVDIVVWVGVALHPVCHKGGS